MYKLTEVLAWLFCTVLVVVGATYAVLVVQGVSTTGKYNRVEVQSAR